MSRILVVVAALLLTVLGNAAAAEEPEHKPKNARKVMMLLGQLGINSREILELVGYVDKRIDHGYLRLAEQRFGPGTLKLHYKVGLRMDLGQLQLHYAPDDSNWRATLSTEGAMVQYRLKF